MFSQICFDFDQNERFYIVLPNYKKKKKSTKMKNLKSVIPKNAGRFAPINFASLQFRPLCKMLMVVDARLYVSQFPVNAT